jgi:adenylate cyclase
MSESAPHTLVDRAARRLETPIAVVDAENFTVIRENARFFQVFASTGDPNETLFDRLPALNAERVRQKINSGRPYTQEIDAKAGARTLSFNVRMTADAEAEPSIIVVECNDITKRKEAEYMLDSYAKMAEKNARELQREKDRVEKLLLNIMPRAVYEELKDYGTTTPQKFDDVSVLMLDFVGFTEMAVSQDPGAVVSELNDIFSAFDRIVELFDCERIKTIGDSYVAVSGMPHANPDNATNLARVALRMRRYLERRNESHPTTWRFRIGLANGALIGSMIGIQKYVYDIFGPAANLAARMEELCEPMAITISPGVQSAISSRFATTPLGETEVKGFGAMPLFRLNFENPR